MTAKVEHGTSIEWTHHAGFKGETWNPVTGCDRVSPGCAHCYALELAPRLRRFAQARGTGKWLGVRDGGKASGPAFGVTLHPAVLEEPLRWRRPRSVFVNSMSDLFHDEIPDEFIGQVFAVMAATPQHRYMVLTKRPERMHDVIRATHWEWSQGFADGLQTIRTAQPWPLPNVWLGVTIENRRFVDRADLLRRTPAAVRFVSAEPLLGPLTNAQCLCCCMPVGHFNLCVDCANDACPYGDCGAEDAPPRPGPGQLDLMLIDWLIVGGESGAQHRRIDEQWVRDLRELARASGTAFFLKQWGGRTPKAGGRELDGVTHDELPEVARA